MLASTTFRGAPLEIIAISNRIGEDTKVVDASIRWHDGGLMGAGAF
jgi:hypothetical protein